MKGRSGQHCTSWCQSPSGGTTVGNADADREERVVSSTAQARQKGNRQIARCFEKKSQSAKAELVWLDARQFKTVCNLRAGIASRDREEDEQKQAAPRKPRPSSHRKFDAVQTAYHLVQLWLVVRRGIFDAGRLSDQSSWYKLSAILFGKDANLLSHMFRYREAMDRAHAAVADGKDGRRVRRKPSQKVPVNDARAG
jgi:hypothetical protein